MNVYVYTHALFVMALIIMLTHFEFYVRTIHRPCIEELIRHTQVKSLTLMTFSTCFQALIYCTRAHNICSCSNCSHAFGRKRKSLKALWTNRTRHIAVGERLNTPR